MREVEVDRFVAATPRRIERAVDPATVVEYEGSFDVLDIEDGDGETVVTAGARGLAMTLRFEPVDGGWRYEQVGREGPFEEMWTELVWEAEDDGVRVTARSGVDLGLPLTPVTGRVAAWKRRGELKRALRTLAAEVE